MPCPQDPTKTPKKRRAWTPERRAAQAERCRAAKPWEHSTGPRTDAGKAKSSLNAYKHGMRSRIFDRLRYMLWLNAEFTAMAGGILREVETNELKNRKDKRLIAKTRTCAPARFYTNEVSKG